MFDDFFISLPILFVSIILLLLFSKAWGKRDLIKSIISHNKLFEIKSLNLTKSERALMKDKFADIKIEYKKNKALAKPISEINFIPIVINLLIAGYNLKLFFINFNHEIDVLINIWVSFFLLMLNFPLFIYKENKENKFVSLFLFSALSLFCFPVLFFYQGLDLIILMIGWLFNYTIFLFFSNAKQIDNLKGQTGFFILFWMFIIFISLVIHFKFDLPEKYNYSFLINVFYFLVNAYFIFISQKYERIDTSDK